MNKDTNKIIMGKIITAMREKAGISRYLLAKEAEVDYAWLRRFEMGKSGIRVETLLQLAKGLNMPAGDIVSIMEEALRNPEQWLKEHENPS